MIIYSLFIVCLLQFGILMLVLFVIGLAGGIACYVKRGQLEDVLENKLNETMHLYSTDSTFQKSWDIMQHEVIYHILLKILFSRQCIIYWRDIEN